MDDLCHPARCCYATAEFANSFLGKYLWLYQGRGRLRLTPDQLRIERDRGPIEIPLHAIKSIGVGRVSAWARPLRPRYLVVRYMDGGEPATLRVFLDDPACRRRGRVRSTPGTTP